MVSTNCALSLIVPGMLQLNSGSSSSKVRRGKVGGFATWNRQHRLSVQSRSCVGLGGSSGRWSGSSESVIWYHVTESRRSDVIGSAANKDLGIEGTGCISKCLILYGSAFESALGWGDLCTGWTSISSSTFDVPQRPDINLPVILSSRILDLVVIDRFWRVDRLH